jgi:acetyltransferase
MLDYLFKPRTVAVIGASNKELNIGNRILKNLIDFGFKGKLFPVHPTEEYVRNIKAYKSILEIPDEVDLAHIVIKNVYVPKVLEDCGKKGVKVVIINSAGFREIGKEGLELEEKLLQLARKYKLRIFGPNCQGIMNSDPNVSVYANFTFTKIKPGNISILAQSGGVGEVINNRFSELGIGIRMYASNGNACDISIQEILEYWGEDEETKVIVLHIESLDDPKEFMNVAKRITKRKPILGMKSGRTEEGAKAITSHTGALVGKDTTTELIFEKCGILGFRTIEELCAAAIAFVNQPLPKGSRIGIVTNSGGPGILATDECIDLGLSLPELSQKEREKLKQNLLPHAAISNPIDVLATGGPKEYSIAVNTLLQAENIDAVLVNFITPFFVDCEAIARELEKLSYNLTKPLLCVLMTNKKEWSKTIEIIKNSRIPVYSFPEVAARALAAMCKYSAWKEKYVEEIPKLLKADKNKASTILSKVTREKETYLINKNAYELLSCYDIPLAKYGFGKSLEQLVELADEIGYPVALKLISKEFIHKTDAGALALNIKNKEELKRSFELLTTKFGTAEYLVQEYIRGKELIIGAKAVDKLGHLIMFGLGGIYVELFKDVIFKLAPITVTEAKEMITSIKSYPLLKGMRGEKSIDFQALTDTILRVSQLVTELPEIKELDLNPVIVDEKYSKVVDVRIKI